MSSSSAQLMKYDADKKKSKIIQSATRGPFYITEFKSLFEKYCIETGSQRTPIVREEQHSRRSSLTGPELLISYKSADKEELEKICYKNYQITTSIMVALQKLLVNISISILKLEFCNLTSQHVDILSDILNKSNSIIEVSLNGNPNEEQNFDLLVQEAPLSSLSLRFCGINIIGIKKIAKALNKSFDTCLLHLNLSSNSICDEGAYYVAQFLRINRTLISLNLADNKIYDGGCLLLVQPLQKFQLELQEIILRRRIRFSILQKEQKVVNISIDGGSQTSNKIGRYLSKSSKSSKDKTDNYSDSFGGSRESTSDSISNIIILNHPFVEDSYEEDKEIYCKGNDALVNLNLSYNRITKEGLTALIQMMTYQRYNMSANDKGISRISIEGNDFNNCEQELEDLKKLLVKKLGLCSSSTSISNKNKSQSSVKRRRSTRPSINQ